MGGADAYKEAVLRIVRLDFVRTKHFLHSSRQWVNQAVVKIDEKLSAMYWAGVKGRPSLYRSRSYAKIGRIRAYPWFFDDLSDGTA